MKKLLMGLVLLWLAWVTGGFGLVALGGAIGAWWLDAAPTLTYVILGVLWVVGLVCSRTVRVLSFGLLKVVLIVATVGLLASAFSSASDEEVATTALLLD